MEKAAKSAQPLDCVDDKRDPGPPSGPGSTYDLALEKRLAAVEAALARCSCEDQLAALSARIAVLEALLGKAAPADVQITNISYKGTSKRTEADEYVEIGNRGGSPADLSGYALHSAGGVGQKFVFAAGTRLEPGQSLRVYTNKLDAQTGGFSYQSKTAIWNNEGDVGTLVDAAGKLVSSYAYGKKREKPAAAKGKKAKTAAPVADESLSAAEIWARVRAAWPGFEFMWRPGASDAELAAAESRLGIQLSDPVRALLKECSGAGFPSRFQTSLAAEVCLLPVEAWQSLSALLLGQDLEPDDETADLILIGEDPSGADYGVYLLLRPSTGEVYSYLLNEGVATPLGSFAKWLLEKRPGNDGTAPGQIYTAAAEDAEGCDDDERGAAAIAKTHRKHLAYGSKHGTSGWERVEKRFIDAVRRLRGE